MSSAIALLVSTCGHLSDVLGEKGAATVLRYAAAEAARDCLLGGDHDVREGLALIETATGMHIDVTVPSHGRVAVKLRDGAVPGDVRLMATAEALVIGYLQGLYRVAGGALPEVEIDGLASSAAEVVG